MDKPENFFKDFMKKRFERNNGQNNDDEYGYTTDEEEIDKEGYAHREGITIKNRFKDLFNSSLGRLESTYKRFLKTRKGTCWELAISLDYHFLKQGKPNHHIVSVKTGALTNHTFNIYVKNKKLHIIDLYMRLQDTEVEDYNHLLKLNTYDKEYDTDENEKNQRSIKNWWVMSEVKNSWKERFKKLGNKNWAKFLGEYDEDGNTEFIIKKENEIYINNKVKYKWNPFKFLAWG